VGIRNTIGPRGFVSDGTPGDGHTLEVGIQYPGYDNSLSLDENGHVVVVPVVNTDNILSASFLLASASVDFPSARTLVAGPGIVINDNGPGTTLQVSASAVVSSSFILSVDFSGAGAYTVSDNVGMWWWNRSGCDLELLDVTVMRMRGGTSGSTVCDVEVDSGGTGGSFTSVYSVGNRPTLNFDDGDPAFVRANTFISSSIAQDAIIRFNILQIDSGTPQNIMAQITMRQVI
jgi:hypothetical protein